KVLRNRKRAHGHAPACPGRFVHLTENQSGARKHARTPQVAQQFVAFARALADTGENRYPRVFLDRGPDQLSDQYRLGHAGAAEHPGLSALGQRRQEIDNLDSTLKYFAGGILAAEWRCGPVDWPSRNV